MKHGGGYPESVKQAPSVYIHQINEHPLQSIIFLNFYYYYFFYKKFMPISARGTTVAQANSECTLITIRMYLSVI